MISGANFSEIVGHMVNDLEAFFAAFAPEDGIEDPDRKDPEAWEYYDTAFQWEAGRVWMNYHLTFYPEERKVRLYFDRAGPAMRAHP